MTLLNDKTILKPGMLAEIVSNKYWSTEYYWNISLQRWNIIPKSTPIIIVAVKEEKIDFLHQNCLYSILNCYNDQEGYPYWCIPHEHKSW